jgi:ribonuclease Z
VIEVTLLGTGSPIPDAQRAGPSTLVRIGDHALLVDCGRGVLQRATAVGVGANALTALLLTHLHSDHIADLGDVLITRWVTTFTPDPPPLPIIGPPAPPRSSTPCSRRSAPTSATGSPTTPT